MELRYQQLSIVGNADEAGEQAVELNSIPAASHRVGHGLRPERSQRSGRVWTQRRIEESGCLISQGVDSLLRIDPVGTSPHRSDGARPIATLLPHRVGELSTAILLLSSVESGSRLLVNGYPPLTVSELTDHAEITLGDTSLFYRAASDTKIELFAGGDEAECQRCRRALAEGDAVLTCRHCSTPYHEGATSDPSLGDLRCASYDATCARCGEPWDQSAADAKDPQHHAEGTDHVE